MAKKSPKNDKSSIKYRWIPLDLPCHDPADLSPARGAQVNSYSRAKYDRKIVTSSSSWTVTTPEFISAVGRLWKAVSQPVNVSQTKTGLENIASSQKENAKCYSGSEGLERTSILLLSDPKSVSCFSPTAKSDYEYVKAIKRMILFDPCRESIRSSLKGHAGFHEFHKSVGSESKMMATATSVGDPHHLVTMYENISGNPPLQSRLSFPENECELVAENCNLEKCTMDTDVSATHSAKVHINLAEHRDSCTGYSRKIACMESSANLAEGRDSSEGDLGSLVENFEQSSSSLYDSYLVSPATSVVEPITLSSCSISSLYSDYNIQCPASIYCTYKECQQSLDSCHMALELTEESVPKDDNAHSDGKNLHCNPVGYRRHSPNLWLSVQNKMEDAFVKGKHAIAGGLAGIFVSLFLHPIDTVKTVIQADGMNQKPIFHTVQSIISERGVLGLYRGIASNIASSAPISAIYTFTYESVKGALLPVLPKEYHSLAHCTAGGCASIATSFIFTPSERIKQQMQECINWNH